MKKGYKIDILTCNIENLDPYEEVDGIRVYRIPSWDLLGGTYAIPKPALSTLRILWHLAHKNYDVINTHTRFMSTSFMGLLFSKIKNTPLIHTEHGSSHSVLSNRATGLIGKMYDITIGKWIIQSAWMNIAVSRSAYDFLRYLGAKNVHIIYNGIDNTIFQNKNSNTREDLGLGHSLIITFVGRLIYGKGVQDLISVFQRLSCTFDDTVLLIVGDGPYRKELESVAEKAGLDKVHFLGMKSKDDLIDVLNGTDIFVNPSYSDGFSLSSLEAGSLGVPIIVSSACGIREIIDNYRTGLIFPAGDKNSLEMQISQLIENEDLRKKIGENMKTLVRAEFTWERAVECYLKIYESAVSKNDLEYV